jgi:hypothetical protein
MNNVMIMRIAAAVIALGAGALALPAAADQKPAAQNLSYDIYVPSERLRTRREASCLSDEDMKGAYCVKKCDKDYVSFGSRPPRCRSAEPLAPGRMPTAIRMQTGTQPLPPGTVLRAPKKPVDPELRAARKPNDHAGGPE